MISYQGARAFGSLTTVILKAVLQDPERWRQKMIDVSIWRGKMKAAMKMVGLVLVAVLMVLLTAPCAVDTADCVSGIVNNG